MLILKKLTNPLVVMLIILLGVIVAVYGLSFGSADGFMPHRYCLGPGSIVFWHFTSDLVIGISYQVISYFLLVGVMRYKPKNSWVLVAFATFIITCGWTHFMELITLWIPVYRAAAVVKIACAIASVTTASFMPSKILDPVVKEISQLGGGNRDD